MMDTPGEYTPRFLAASQSDLTSAMEAGAVRKDLYYRLSGTTLDVPSLRERVDDIPLLVEHFLLREEKLGQAPRVLSLEAAEIFRNYSWPGNVRQLENAVRSLGLISRAVEITAGEVRQVLGNQPEIKSMRRAGDTEKLGASVAQHLRRYFDLHGNILPPEGLYGRILREIEAPLLEIALDATGGNQAKCSNLLGINRNTLRKKISDLDIQVTRRRKLM
jgi:two-component system nitrogen regulation response regulator GlnG